uniref:hypothetical protein n=1 Tax=Thermoplasma acidophilum TaxID=2303 RepID=UPI0034E0DC05
MKGPITIRIQVTSGSYESLRKHKRKIEKPWIQPGPALLIYYQKEKGRWTRTIEQFIHHSWNPIENLETWTRAIEELYKPIEEAFRGP